MPGRRRNRKSRNWADRHLGDQYVRKAQQSGYRARSVYKLIDIDRKYNLIRPDSRIIDLGSSPGGWSQYASSRISARNRITCVDRLPMPPLEKTLFIQGDFTDPETRRQARDSSPNGRFDLVLSDMTPNITGIRPADQANAEELQYAILEFCRIALRPGGRLLTKYFEGENAHVFRKRFQGHFDQIRVIKPDASRPESREVYLLGGGFKPMDSGGIH
ncbi:MAG: RlmE family RNA methyltransferase [Gammaproteobacteria bacterium]|nr:RlmE family RNA methyltransferase [Gammaproteobacteria bacterium]